MLPAQQHGQIRVSSRNVAFFFKFQHPCACIKQPQIENIVAKKTCKHHCQKRQIVKILILLQNRAILWKSLVNLGSLPWRLQVEDGEDEVEVEEVEEVKEVEEVEAPHEPHQRVGCVSPEDWIAAKIERRRAAECCCRVLLITTQ